GSFEAFPHADRHESEQDRINDADDRQDETGQIVVLDAKRSRRRFVYDERDGERRRHEPGDDDRSGDQHRERFEPFEHRERSYGSGSSDVVDGAASDALAGTPDMTSCRYWMRRFAFLATSSCNS